jgi:3-hydroxyisobutyrate dehydrogenase
MSTSTPSAVGLIGLGAMGLGMAQSLRRAGFAPHVFDIRKEVAQSFAKDGGHACDSLSHMAQHCEVIFSVVVNAAQTESILFGQDGLADHMRPGAVFVMCSTVDPNWSAALETRLADKGLLYLDSPISGGSVRAANGEITMMTGGQPQAYEKAEPFMQAMAAKIYKLGAAGAGTKVKIVNQLLAGVHIAAAAEAMALGIREGLEPAQLYEVITNRAGNSWMFENRMQQVVSGDYAPWSAVDIFVKDLGLVLDTARASKFPLPIASTAHQMFMQASTAGHGAEGDSAVIKIFPGINLPKKSS